MEDRDSSQRWPSPRRPSEESSREESPSGEAPSGNALPESSSPQTDPPAPTSGSEGSSAGELSGFYQDLPDFGPIPEELHSAYTDTRFTKCMVCDLALAESGLYEIQKVFRGSECVFELAICHGCLQGIVSEYSEESKNAITEFHLGNVQLVRDNCCEFCAAPRERTKRYTLVGACRADSLVLPVIVVCEKCEETINGLLSKKTRDIHGDFIRDHFPGVPADLEFNPTFGGMI